MSLPTVRKLSLLATMFAVSLLYFNLTSVTTFDGWQLLGVWIMLVSITGYERYINNIGASFDYQPRIASKYMNYSYEISDRGACCENGFFLCKAI